MTGRRTVEEVLAELEEAHRRIAHMEEAARLNEQRVEESTKALRRRNEELQGLIGERATVEEQLRKSEESYRSFVERSAEGIWKLEIDPPIATALPEDEQIALFFARVRLSECNDAMAKMYGAAGANELLGVSLGDLLVPADENNIAYLRAFIRSGYQLADAESHELDAQGNDKFFLNNLTGVSRDSGDGGTVITGAWGTQRDITERKRAERITQGQQKILEMIARGSTLNDVLDALVRFIESECSGAVCSILLLDKEQGRLYHNQAPRLPAAFVRAIDGLLVAEGSGVCGTAAFRKETVIVADVMRDGLCVPFRELAAEHRIGACWSAPIVARTGRILGTFAMYFEGPRQPAPHEEKLMDLSSRLAAITIEHDLSEQALKASEAKFRAVAESSPVAILIYRPDRFVYVNPAMTTITGYGSEALLQMGPFDLLVPAHRETAESRAAARQRGEPIASTIEYQFRTRSGEERWVEFSVGDFIHHEGERLATGTCFDITDRKRAEEQLANEKERLSVTLRSIGDGVIATDTKGKILLLNRVAERMTGWRQEEAIGRPLSDVFHIISEKTRERRPEPTVTVLRTGRGFEMENGTVLVSRDGSELVIADSAAPIYDRESRIIGVVIVFRDETEQRQREEELLKASKLESIGLLAGGIAHDFNNILTAILGNVSLAKLFLEVSHKAYQRLEETEQAAMRAKDLTQQLLTFARGGAPVRKAASLVRLLREGVNFALTGSPIECSLMVEDGLWLADVDEGQINQVIHNLVLNARQAMPLGGRIDVRAENLPLRKGERLHGLPARAPAYVRITVRDRGVGIPEEYIGKIFDPYFTTKQKGSGLGLATAYSIITNHDGYIFVESPPGEGTTFTLYLPASGENEATASAGTREPLPGKGKILVMDDETVLREMIGDMLDFLGYSCEGAKSGEEAIEMYQRAREAGEPFDALIVDLTVPGGMGGKEALRRLREIDPDVKCIVSSGYSNDPIMADYQAHGFVAVIAKPYQISQLGDVLHDVLGRA